MRLQNFLTEAGVVSRRNVIHILNSGDVKVNDDVVRIPSYPIFPDKDTVTYCGREVKLVSKIYYMFHKPKGVVTTVKDTHGRQTVLDFFKHVKARLYPVGRLDRDTTGLLLLTNDGNLTHKLTHPRFGVRKIYEALLDKALSEEEAKKLEQGVVIEGHKTAPCRIQILETQNGRSRVEIMLHEGRKRQIRLMFRSIGFTVIHLHRKRYGPLELRGLPPGKSRELSPSEVQALTHSISGEPASHGSRRPHRPGRQRGRRGRSFHKENEKQKSG